MTIQLTLAGLSFGIYGETITITNLSSNARMWSALHGERPSFYGLNMGLCLPFAVGVRRARSLQLSMPVELLA